MAEHELLHGIPSEAYHADPAVSKSRLDLVAQSPAMLAWDAAAPEDEDASSQVNIGSAFEALLLEPGRFNQSYIQDTDKPKNTKEGKSEAQEIRDRADREGLEILSPADWRKIRLMMESAMVHPVVRQIMDAGPIPQPSIWWTDSETGLRCKARPDIMMPERPLVADIKITGQIERFANSVHDYRYHVQDAWAVDAFTPVYGREPASVFIVVSSTLSARKYPVHVYELTREDRDQGRRLYRRDLETYAHREELGDWTHIEPLTRPGWAWRQDEQE